MTRFTKYPKGVFLIMLGIYQIMVVINYFV